MKKYGLKIGDVGVEFVSQEEREKALMIFTKGVDVKINTSGIRYSDGDGSFSVYDRDTKEILVTCKICEGVFGIDSCGDREYPHKNAWEKEYTIERGHICDACMARALQSKEVFEAHKVIENVES